MTTAKRRAPVRGRAPVLPPVPEYMRDLEDRAWRRRHRWTDLGVQPGLSEPAERHSDCEYCGAGPDWDHAEWCTATITGRAMPAAQREAHRQAFLVERGERMTPRTLESTSFEATAGLLVAPGEVVPTTLPEDDSRWLTDRTPARRSCPRPAEACPTAPSSGTRPGRPSGG